MSKKKNKLKNLKVNEISAVDIGANQEADIILFKRDSDIINVNTVLDREKESKGVLNMDPKQLAKALEDTQKELEKAKKEKEKTDEDKKKLEEDMGDLKKQHEELVSKFEKLESNDPTNEEVEKKEKEQMEAFNKRVQDEIQKAIAPVLKQNEELTKKNDEISKKLEMTELAKQASEMFPNLTGSSEEKAKLLKFANSIEDEEFKKYTLELLKSSDEALSKNFEEIGVASLGSSEPEQKLETLAKSLQKENTGMTFEQAYTKVLTTPEGSKLYSEMGSK